IRWSAHSKIALAPLGPCCRVQCKRDLTLCILSPPAGLKGLIGADALHDPASDRLVGEQSGGRDWKAHVAPVHGCQPWQELLVSSLVRAGAVLRSTASARSASCRARNAP